MNKYGRYTWIFADELIEKTLFSPCSLLGRDQVHPVTQINESVKTQFFIPDKTRSL